MITRQQALTGQVFHMDGCKRDVGPRGGVKVKMQVYRRSGSTKIWKTRPDEFSIPVNIGWKGHGHITHANQHLVHLEEECPLRLADATLFRL